MTTYNICYQYKHCKNISNGCLWLINKSCQTGHYDKCFDSDLSGDWVVYVKIPVVIYYMIKNKINNKV
jgi:hypothetical protein